VTQHMMVLPLLTLKQRISPGLISPEHLLQTLTSKGQIWPTLTLIVPIYPKRT